MTTISPKSPLEDSSTYSHLNVKTTADLSEYIDKEGKKYKVEVQTIHHDLPWKVWQGVQALFLTIFSLGIGFAFQTFRDTWKQKWKQAVTGDEKVTVFTRYSPKEDAQTLKTNRIGTFLNPAVEPPLREEVQTLKENQVEASLQLTAELPLEVRNFIQKARQDITKIPINDLENGLNEVLKVASDIKDPEDKTTLLTIAERVAQSHLTNLSYDEAFRLRIEVAQAIRLGAPLADLQVALQNEHTKLGVKLYPVDTSLFKNHSLGVQRRTFTDGTTQLHFNAKLSHPTRQKLIDTIDAIKPIPDLLLNALPPGFCKNVKTYTEQTFYEGRTDGAKKWEGNFSPLNSKGFSVYSDFTKETCYSQVIEFEGAGKVKIATSDFHAEFNRISIDLDPTISEAEAAEKLNIIFAALGLGAVSSSARTEDTERIKVMQLFRAFYPKEAYDFERNATSFEESIENLKARISNKVPDMQNKLQEYLIDHPEKMYQQEVYPGQSIWCVKGLSDDVRKEGGIGLMSGVTASNFPDAITRLMSILRGGALSSQDRFELGIIAIGDSSGEDLRTGGGDSVFLRLITKGMSKDLNSYSLAGKMQILYDMDLVERVGYVYPGDKYGTKDPLAYQDRKNIKELTHQLEKHPHYHTNNEICIHHRVGPEFIKGIRVNNHLEKQELIKALEKEGLVNKNHLNQDCFNDIPLDQFIRVGDIKAEYWA